MWKAQITRRDAALGLGFGSCANSRYVDVVFHAFSLAESFVYVGVCRLSLDRYMARKGVMMDMRSEYEIWRSDTEAILLLIVDALPLALGGYDVMHISL